MPKKKRFDVREHNRKHGGHAAYRRYGLQLTETDFEAMRSLIWTKKAVLVEDQVLKQVWDLVYKDIPMRVVYSPGKNRIVTFLTLGAKPYS